MFAFPTRVDAPERRPMRIELQKIRPCPAQPRRQFDESSIRELADSIRRYGLLSPLLVRQSAHGEYTLIAGERRLRAMRLLGHASADAIVLDFSAADSALVALIENLQREDLHYLDEAEACRRILQQQGLTQEQLAAALSKSPSTLANLLRLLKLPRSVRIRVRQSGLSERHARALLKLRGEEEQLELAALAEDNRLSVRALEDEIERRLRNGSPNSSIKKPIARFIRDNRFVMNAFYETMRQLRRIGVCLQSRVETREGEYDVIITVKAPQ